MKINHVISPKSSFLSLEKDLGIIINKIMANTRLQKLMYYNVKDPLSEAVLSEEQVLELIENNIKIVPYINYDNEIRNYVVITFDSFIPNGTNPEFRDNFIYIDVLSHKSCWQLKDFQLRPYRIAAEIDSMLDKERLTGIGKLAFLGSSVFTQPNTDYGGITLIYEAIHGEEDKTKMPNPQDEAQFIKDQMGVI